MSTRHGIANRLLCVQKTEITQLKPQTCCAVLLGAISAFAVAHASEIGEVELNHPIVSAQHVDVPAKGAAINAVLGNLTGSAVDDLDFYTFYGQEGDLVTLDIDGGYGGARDIDTFIAIFATTAGYPMLRVNDDAAPLDEGSTSSLDSRIEKFRLPTTGHYIVGVSNYPRYFKNGGTVWNPTTFRNGDYSLIISGVSSRILQINIEIKPGSSDLAPINPKSKGKIPVALLSSNDFNAMNTDTTSLAFGPTGEERSLSHCGRGEDVNADGRLDLVCHFHNQAAGFEPGDLEGIVRGITDDGRVFEGRGLLKVVPEKR